MFPTSSVKIDSKLLKPKGMSPVLGKNRKDIKDPKSAQTLMPFSLISKNPILRPSYSAPAAATYIIDEDWGTAALGAYVGADGPGLSDIYTHSGAVRWQVTGNPAGSETVHIYTEGGTKSGQIVQFDNTSGHENDSGIYYCSSGGLPGASKKIYVAQKLKYVGYSDAGSGFVKKTFRIVNSNGDTLSTLNAQSGVWRVYFETPGGGGPYDQSAPSAVTYGPDTFIGTYRWLEYYLDFTNISAPAYSVWVDGNLIMSGTDSTAYDIGSYTLSYVKVSTTFNNPARDGSDHIQRVILNDSHIGIPT